MGGRRCLSFAATTTRKFRLLSILFSLLVRSFFLCFLFFSPSSFLTDTVSKGRLEDFSLFLFFFNKKKSHPALPGFDWTPFDFDGISSRCTEFYRVSGVFFQFR